MKGLPSMVACTLPRPSIRGGLPSKVRWELPVAVTDHQVDLAALLDLLPLHRVLGDDRSSGLSLGSCLTVPAGLVGLSTSLASSRLKPVRSGASIILFSAPCSP